VSGMYVCMYVYVIKKNIVIYLIYDRLAPASHEYNADNKVFLYYIMHVKYIKTFLLNHSINCNALGNFIDLHIYGDRQREATLLYTCLGL
jgi:hypothetical protein